MLLHLSLDQTVHKLDPSSKSLTFGNGERLTNDALALTTGSVPRKLPSSLGGGLGGVFTLRNLGDVDKMAHYYTKGRRVLIIGGGYIGLEAAAVTAKCGLQVTLVEMAERILMRVACQETWDYFRVLHQSPGVDIREGVGLDGLRGQDHVQAAVLSDATELDIDFAIVGVGIKPSIELAETAGLEVANGIVTDGQARTSDPNV